MTHTREKAERCGTLVRPVVADGLDRASVMDAVVRAEPEAVIHQMTGLAGITSFKKLGDQLAPEQPTFSVLNFVPEYVDLT
jgi:hypothetical protein